MASLPNSSRAEIRAKLVGLHVRLGEMYARQNRWKDAVGLLEAYLQHDPDDETGRHALAEARAKLAAPGG